MNVFARFPGLLRHLASGAIVQLLGLVVVRRHLEQPRVLDLDDLAHEFLRREDQFVVDEPARPVLGDAAVRVDHDGRLVLDRLVVAALAQSGGVVEKPGSYRLEKTMNNSRTVKFYCLTN